MNKRLIYLPLEPYMERYTWFMSAENGWAEDHFTRNNIDFIRIDGDKLRTNIKHGKVLDATGRCYYALNQIQTVVEMINDGIINDNDVIYVEDFWHPGIESLFYIRALTGLKFKIGTFLHAQSVDNSDFAYSMRDWMRGIEQGYGKGYDYIFVTSEILKTLCIDAGIGTAEKIHNVGLPFNSNRLFMQLYQMGFNHDMFSEKEKYVIFSSRFDEEKNPLFFLQLVERCPDIMFKLVNPRQGNICNNKTICNALNDVLARCNNLEVIYTGGDKLNYYNALARAKVQINTANQDWTSWTILEAIAFDCLPLYPIWKDFPVELKNDSRYLYGYLDLDAAELKLRRLMLTTDAQHKQQAKDLEYVIQKHNNSWKKYLEVMGFNV